MLVTSSFVIPSRRLMYQCAPFRLVKFPKHKTRHSWRHLWLPCCQLGMYKKVVLCLPFNRCLDLQFIYVPCIFSHYLTGTCAKMRTIQKFQESLECARCRSFLVCCVGRTFLSSDCKAVFKITASSCIACKRIRKVVYFEEPSLPCKICFGSLAMSAWL